MVMTEAIQGQRKMPGRKTVKLTIGLEQAKRIFANSGSRYSDGISDGFRKQIVSKVKKAFPEIADAERQHNLAWEILKRVQESPEAVSIKAEGKPELDEARKSLEELRKKDSEAYQRLNTLQGEINAKLDELVNAEFEKAGITFYKASGNGLLVVGGSDRY